MTLPGTPTTPAGTRTSRRDLRAFTALVAGYAVSTFGNFVNLVALNLYAYHLTGSALQTGVLMAVRLATGFLAGPVAGRLVTRRDRRAVMVVTDLGQAASMIALLVTPSTMHSWVLYPVAAVLGAGNTVFTVALRTSVPEMVGAEDRVRGNGYLLTGKSVAMVLGFASAGPLVGGIGFPAAFAVNAGSFLVSAAVLVRSPLSFRRSADVGHRPSGSVSSRSVSSESAGPKPAAAGLRTVRVLLAGPPIVAAMVALRGVDAWGSASHNVALPLLATDMDPGNPAAVLSQFWTAWAVGTLLIQAVALRSPRAGRSLDERAFAIAACVMSLAFVAAFTAPPAPLLVATALVAGMADGFTELAYSSRLQAAPDDVRGILFGASASVETLGFATGMFASGVVLDHVAPLPVVVVGHGLVVAAAAAFLLLARTRWRAPDRAVAAPPDQPGRSGQPGQSGRA
ncbi:MFS transporter [Plantactinospora sp. WMMC1484]|uniref:MFS transporter n=1 Tax=Plantactinospora sp. WMMC1484 TaxID=3404122 RepID=UPI003BF4E65B